MWLYESPVRKITISHYRDKYALRINEDFCELYLTPESAADNVYTQHTNYDLWDFFPAPDDLPSCLAEWLTIQDPR